VKGSGNHSGKDLVKGGTLFPFNKVDDEVKVRRKRQKFMKEKVGGEDSKSQISSDTKTKTTSESASNDLARQNRGLEMAYNELHLDYNKNRNADPKSTNSSGFMGSSTSG